MGVSEKTSGRNSWHFERVVVLRDLKAFLNGDDDILLKWNPSTVYREIFWLWEDANRERNNGYGRRRGNTTTVLTQAIGSVQVRDLDRPYASEELTLRAWTYMFKNWYDIEIPLDECRFDESRVLTLVRFWRGSGTKLFSAEIETLTMRVEEGSETIFFSCVARGLISLPEDLRFQVFENQNTRRDSHCPRGGIYKGRVLRGEKIVALFEAESSRGRSVLHIYSLI